MHGFVTLCLLITVTAITPGPNNFVILTEAAAKGVRGALPAIGALAASSAVMLVAGSSFLVFANVEPLLPWIGAVAGFLLAAMAISQWRGAKTHIPQRPRNIHAMALALLQSANPKAWILVVVVLAGSRSAGVSIGDAALLLAVISFGCSLCWGALGASIARALADRRSGPWLRRGLAGALLGTALHLSYSQLGAIL
jgi:threonine/homoserine/homoserine lactone efflux protein